MDEDASGKTISYGGLPIAHSNILPFLPIPTLPAFLPCDLGMEQSKFTTELMAVEWEWKISTGFSTPSENVPTLSQL